MSKLKNVKIYEEDLCFLNELKKKTGIVASPMILKLALAEFKDSKTYAKIVLGLK